MPRLLIAFLSAMVIVSCGDSGSPNEPPIQTSSLVTFIELGSVNCIPCREMQPIMKSLEERYGPRQLTVLFIDVIKDRKAAEPYKIIVMPTQVFLDSEGVEFHRHEGFYPEAEIDSLLQSRGLVPLAGGK